MTFNFLVKVETPYHDNDLILTHIISSQSGWQWTWSCPELHMGGFRDGGLQFLTFWRSLDGTPNFWYIRIFFFAMNFVASQLFLCLFWISLWFRIGVYNTLASKCYVKFLFLPYAAIAIYLVCGQCKSTKHMKEGWQQGGQKGNSSKVGTLKWTHVCCPRAICMTNLLFGPNQSTRA
jgi:hypothetical protein